MIDNQNVGTVESGGVWGYERGKRIKGRKRYTLVGTDGRTLKLQAHATDIQDRDGTGPLLRALRPRWLLVRLVCADADYQAPRVAAVIPVQVKIVRKLEDQVELAVHAKR